MDKQELISHLDLLMTFARQAPYSDHINIPEESGEELLETAQKLGMVQEINDPAGDVISIEGDEAILSTYYSNNILHVFALPSLIASIFQRHDDVTHEHIINAVKTVYPFLHQELYVRWNIEELDQRAEQLIQTMLDNKLLLKRGDEYVPADSEAPQWSRLMLLAQAVQPALQRYAMSLTILFSLKPEQVIHRAELEQESQKLAQRIAALYGINAPEFFDKNLFKTQVKVLKEQGWVEHREGIGMRATKSCEDLYHSILSMLSVPVQQGLQQAARSLRQQARDQILLVDESSPKLEVQDDSQKED